MKLITYIPGSLCLAVLLTAGCQEAGPGETASAGEWKKYESANDTFRFEYPALLRRKDKYSNPVGVLFEKGPNDVSIVVMHGSDGDHDDEFAEQMISLGTEDAASIGERQPIEIGPASGLRQDYKIKDGPRYRLGSLIAVTTDKDRVVFDVTYPEQWKGEFESVVDRVVGSLQFSDSASQTTKPVSTMK